MKSKASIYKRPIACVLSSHAASATRIPTRQKQSSEEEREINWLGQGGENVRQVESLSRLAEPRSSVSRRCFSCMSEITTHAECTGWRRTLKAKSAGMAEHPTRDRELRCGLGFWATASKNWIRGKAGVARPHNPHLAFAVKLGSPLDWLGFGLPNEDSHPCWPRWRF